MSKWLRFALLSLFVPFAFGQWAPAPTNPQPQGGYPQSQYPDSGQQNQQSSDAPDPADLQHGVARISIVQGDVNIRRGDNSQLSSAVINAPLLAHDHLETSPGSRAEVQLDAATIIRLSSNTDLGFADLQYHRAQVQLGLGSLIFRVLPNAATQVEIDTPSIGVRALTAGEYRISVFDNGTSQVTVRSGQIELSGPRGSERLNAGSSVMIRGDASDPEMQTTAELAPDQFDQWSQDRDREFIAPPSARYVNADVQGAADLDQYGNWVSSGYGQVWRPQGVAADWSPYSNGQWSYVDYYGWSWIDYSPWGWAPYHYGRWFWNTGYGWCWWPGGHGFHSYWSPALVGFFGFGGRVGIGFGGLGWVALAPFEGFHRWWGRAGYFNSYGGYRGAYGLGGYRNAGFRGGALTAGVNGFGGAHQRFFAATRAQISGASSFTGRLPVTATQSSYNYGSRAPVVNSRFASVQSRGFYHQNSQVRSTPNAGWQHVGSASPGTGSYRPNTSAGWQQHFGSPAAGSSGSQSASRNSETSGWHSFGRPQPSVNSFQSQHYSSPSYGSAPRPSYSAPAYNAAPRQSYRPAPAQHQSQPHYSAPSGARGNSGGGASSHSSGGGGGGHHHR